MCADLYIPDGALPPAYTVSFLIHPFGNMFVLECTSRTCPGILSTAVDDVIMTATCWMQVMRHTAYTLSLLTPPPLLDTPPPSGPPPPLPAPPLPPPPPPRPTRVPSKRWVRVRTGCVPHQGASSLVTSPAALMPCCLDTWPSTNTHQWPHPCYETR